jgi:hypothetical protein
MGKYTSVPQITSLPIFLEFQTNNKKEINERNSYICKNLWQLLRSNTNSCAIKWSPKGFLVEKDCVENQISRLEAWKTKSQMSIFVYNQWAKAVLFWNPTWS